MQLADLLSRHAVTGRIEFIGLRPARLDPVIEVQTVHAEPGACRRSSRQRRKARSHAHPGGTPAPDCRLCRSGEGRAGGPAPQSCRLANQPCRLAQQDRPHWHGARPGARSLRPVFSHGASSRPWRLQRHAWPWRVLCGGGTGGHHCPWRRCGSASHVITRALNNHGSEQDSRLDLAAVGGDTIAKAAEFRRRRHCE